jgi:hypothetical protein
MTDPMMWTSIATAAFGGLVVVTVALLKGWRDWLALQRLSLERRQGDAPASPAAARIELADLKERVRKLEAIAAGVDL